MLRDIIINGKPDGLVSEHVLERVPHIFANDWPQYRRWRKELSSRLNVDPREIAITGSACVGFSLSPHKNLRAFTVTSDVDVAVVSEWHFSEAWQTLRSIDTTFARLSPAQISSVKNHQTNYIYWGCIATDKILPLLPFAAKWMEALAYMAGVDPTAGRTINARIYKDFKALSSYQELSVKKLRAELLSTS